MDLTVFLLDFGYELLWVYDTKFSLARGYLYKQVSQDREESFILPSSSSSPFFFLCLKLLLLVS